jgi:hypothetical protein
MLCTTHAAEEPRAIGPNLKLIPFFPNLMNKRKSDQGHHHHLKVNRPYEKFCVRKNANNGSRRCSKDHPLAVLDANMWHIGLNVTFYIQICYTRAECRASYCVRSFLPCCLACSYFHRSYHPKKLLRGIVKWLSCRALADTAASNAPREIKSPFR